MSDNMLAGNDAQTVNRAKGGKARAEALPATRRSEIAKQAARTRWDVSIPEVEFGNTDRPLRLGEIEVDCYVLTGGMRVFSQRGMFEALGVTSRGGEIQRLLEQGGIRAFLSDDAVSTLRSPVRFRRRGGGRLVSGYPVELLVDLCNAIIDASEIAGFPKYYDLACLRANIIIRAVAKVGIIALVDEATGYDEHRQEKLQALLDRYLRKELAAWSKRFPDEFYEQIFRLRNWNWKGRHVNPPGAVAHYTKDLVYARLAPGVLKELETRNPVVGKSRKAKHHQFLTDDVGHPELQRHLYMVIGIMKSETSWGGLIERLDRALPRFGENLRLPLLDWNGDHI
jgi:hypothetical protein